MKESMTVSMTESTQASATDILNFIGGKLVPAVGGGWLDNHEPATGKAYSRLADSDERDVELAVAAAREAFPAWSALKAEQRALHLRAIAALLIRDLDAMARIESRDNGKPVSVAREVDIPRSVANLEFFADAATQFSSETHATSSEFLNFTLRQPLGVVGCISPWNLPLYLFTWKIAPALAAGNTVVAKPSEVTPMSAFVFARICAAAALPPGVLNIVHGTGPKVGAAISRNPSIKAISFTGSTATGAAIAREAAPSFKKLSLEMGGKNPAVVFGDCDLGRAARETVRAAYSNQGQICLCGSRIYVERGIYEPFKKAFLAELAKLKCGDPELDATTQGALVSKAHYEKVLSHLALAREEGGMVLAGGAPAKVDGRCENGWFVEPTLIEGLPNACRTNQEEIFGPVATIQPFDTESEALRLANESRYGLAASVWTRDLDRAHRFSQALHAGIVWVNCWMVRDLRTPFGGMKESGVGREGGLEALRFFTEPRNICVRIAPEGERP